VSGLRADAVSTKVDAYQNAGLFWWVPTLVGTDVTALRAASLA